MQALIDYLKNKYHPIGLIVYGSFANGTNNLNSDFDALLICSVEEASHDSSITDGVELDVFLYPLNTFENNYDIRDYIQIWDGKICVDETGVVKKLQDEAKAYIKNYPVKSDAEIAQSLAWCEKMLKRTQRNDAEGLFRLHWLLVDSLEIYFDVLKQYYFGPKKALKEMAHIDPIGASLYYGALKEPTEQNLTNWICHLRSQSVLFRHE